MVDLRINETLQTGAVRKPDLPFSRLVGTVSNSAYAVRLETAPTGGESVYLFLEFTINGLYQRILALHEQAGGSGKDIHQQMVENNLVGADIMPNASHLTASIIASTYPNVKIGKTRIHTMAYGTQRPDGRYAIGALDLLENPEATLSLGLINTEQGSR